MRLLFLVPTNIHKVTAGSRIRYDRLGTTGNRFDIVVQSLEELSAADLEGYDVYVFSKTYSVEAIAIARQLQQQGKIVGVDLFDDYFSQTDDSRLIRFRMWLQHFADTFQFALCSTHVMKRLLEQYAPQLPVHVVPDPFPEIDSSSLAAALAAKLDKARAERAIDVLWFGNGSNPFFSVGLRDVAAFSWSLADLASGAFDLRLTILTDKASQTADNLARLSKLAVDYRLATWSVEAEEEALEQALVSFIPVNGQSFSRAKSFNRALTAISAATQVLSPGFPLYRDLGSAIYTDALELLSDLECGECRIRPDNAREVTTMASDVSEAGTVVDDLFLFLSQQLHAGGRRQTSQSLGATSPPERFQVRKQALIYGLEHDGSMVKAAQTVGILSVKTPFSRRERAYHVRIEHRIGRQLDIWIVPALVSFLPESIRSKCAPPKNVGKHPMIKVDAGDEALLNRDPWISTKDKRAIVQETDAYREFLVDVERVCRRMFPAWQFLISDMHAYSCVPKQS